MDKLMSLIGAFTIIGTAYLLSDSKKQIKWRLVFWGFTLQLVIGILIIPDSFFNGWIKEITGLSVSPGEWFFNQINAIVLKILSFSDSGVDFMLANFLDKSVSPVFTNILFRVLPIIVFFSALISVLYHLGIMQKIINFFAVLMAKTMKSSGAESFAIASNIFVGMIEAPLAIRPFLAKLTRSELFTIMVSGMATIAGSVLGAYVAILNTSIPEIAGHLLTASVMSTPAALVLSKMMIPETRTPDTMSHLNVKVPKTASNVFDAATQGTSDGLKIAFTVGAVLLVFVAFIHMFNFMITTPQGWLGMVHPLKLEDLAAYLFAPVAFLLGVPTEDLLEAGTLLGKKTIVNELIAYEHLASLKGQLTERSQIIMSYALCGFANFGSIGIMIGGLGAMVPERRKEIARLGLKSMLAGLLAGFMTACIAGLII